MTPLRLLLICGCAALLAACAAPPSAPTVEASAEPAAAASAAELPAAPAGPPTPATQQQAQKLAIAAVDLLEAGNEEQARADLARALLGDPANKLALNLMRQITGDPVALLGRESFAYTVRSSDTLSRIAGRFLGDIYAFYILARYNDIKIPRQVAGGQVIRIPGKAPPAGALERDPRRPEPVAAPAPAAPASAEPVATAPSEPSAGERALRTAQAAERAGDLDRALAEYQRAAGLDQPDAAAKAVNLRRQLVARYTLRARSAFAKQDLDGSIRSWDRVIDLEPGHDTARLERRKALELKEKVRSLK